MGLFEKIFGRKPKREKDGGEWFRTLTAYTPVWNTYSGRAYESLVVRAAIDTRARFMSKLKVSTTGSAQPDLSRRLAPSPNEWQTWGQFLYRVSTILDMQNTVFIVPIFNRDGGKTGFYPVLPSRCEIVESGGEAYLRYRFLSGDHGAALFDECALMTKFQYTDDFFGESNSPLKETLSLIDLADQGVAEAIKSSATFRFMARANNFAKSEDLAKERKRFAKENMQNEDGGLLLFPNTYNEIKQIESRPYTVPADELNLIKENVFNYFAVNENMIQSKALGDDLDAFFESVIEPFSLQLQQTLTKATFTRGEQARGSEFLVTANRLMFMNTKQKTEFAVNFGDRGMLTIDEARALFGYDPLPNGAGKKAPIRGEYHYSNDNDNKKDEDKKEEDNE